MSTIREDPLTGALAVVAPARIPAPPAFGRGHLPTVARCPFCPGNEADCGPEIDRVDGAEGWIARAFPNRRPGLSLEAAAGPLRGDGLTGWGGRGAHEVIALGRDHGALDLEARHAGLLLAARRVRDLLGDPGFAAIGWFRNRGLEAGASQPHDHAQIMAMPVVPPGLAARGAPAEAWAGWLETARRDERVVYADEALVAFTPWAPDAPFEVRIVPRAQLAYWHDDEAALAPLARLLHRLVQALDGMSGFTSHNLVASFAPRAAAPGSWRWQVTLRPRLVPVAGFELWSGATMQPIDPVTAAAMLRDAVA